MKYFKSILAIIVLAVGFVACEEEEISYAFQEISAPSDVTAVFDITQDDTGLVTVTPSGEGAQEFQVYWGDAQNEEPELVSPGGSLEHVYEEGEFQVRVIAIGSTGLTSEFNQMVNVSFSAPENLKVTIDQNDPNPLLVKVSATADNATMFEVYFGLGEDEEPTPLMPGETAEYVYAAAGDYTIKVIAKGASATTVEYTEDITVSEASGVIVLPITFDDASVNYAGNIEGAFSVVDNPAPGGANEVESKVGAIENAGALYEAIVINLGEPVDFADNKEMKMKVWSTSATSVLMKFEGGVEDERANEVLAAHGGTGWEELTFDFENDAVKSFIEGDPENGQPFVPTGKYNTLVVFVGFAEELAGTFYIDDIEQDGLCKPCDDCEEELEENIDPANGDINWTFKTNDFAHTFEPFGDIQAEIVANPNPGGINESCNVQSYIKTAGCQTWSGVGKGLANAIDLTTAENKVFTLMVYGETKATTVTLQLEFEPFPNTDPLVAINQEMTKVGEWEELTFDFSEHTDKTFKSIIVYFDRDNTCDDAVYYFDNLKQVPSGGGGTPTEPTSAAPAPSQSESDVISLFSDSYTDVTVDTWRTDWSDATLEDVTIDGSAMKKYSALSFVGIETVSSTIDASGMTHFRTDVWSADFEEFKVKLVDFGADGMFGGGDDVEHEIVIPSPAQGQWVSLDIPLSDFTGLTTREHIAQLIYVGAPSGNNTVFVDNVYFYNDGTGGGAPTEPTSAAPTPDVPAGNVISMFSDAYDDVAVDTWRTDWSNATLEDVSVDGNATKKYSALNFVGIETVASQIDATSMTQFHLDVWSADFTQFRVKLVDFGADGAFGGGDDVEHEIIVESPSQGEWISLELDLSDFTGLTTRANIAQLILSGDPSGNITVYVDNVYFHN